SIRPRPLSPPFLIPNTAPSQIYTLSLHDALPISCQAARGSSNDSAAIGRCLAVFERRSVKADDPVERRLKACVKMLKKFTISVRSEEHTSELQSRGHLVCRLLLEKKNHIEYYELP